MDQEGENDHLMKAVMRALNSAQEKVLPITQVSARLPCDTNSILIEDGGHGVMLSVEAVVVIMPAVP